MKKYAQIVVRFEGKRNIDYVFPYENLRELILRTEVSLVDALRANEGSTFQSFEVIPNYTC
jgi:hypothetical protein